MIKTATLTPNALYQADALLFLERLKSRSVNLVYLDPPWFPNDNPHVDGEDLREHLIFFVKSPTTKSQSVN